MSGELLVGGEGTGRGTGLMFCALVARARVIEGLALRICGIVMFKDDLLPGLRPTTRGRLG